MPEEEHDICFHVQSLDWSSSLIMDIANVKISPVLNIQSPQTV